MRSSSTSPIAMPPSSQQQCFPLDLFSSATARAMTTTTTTTGGGDGSDLRKRVRFSEDTAAMVHPPASPSSRKRVKWLESMYREVKRIRNQASPPPPPPAQAAIREEEEEEEEVMMIEELRYSVDPLVMCRYAPIRLWPPPPPPPSSLQIIPAPPPPILLRALPDDQCYTPPPSRCTIEELPSDDDDDAKMEAEMDSSLAKLQL